MPRRGERMRDRARRRMRDRARSRRRDYGMEHSRRYMGSEHDYRRDYGDYARRDMAMAGRHYEPTREFDGHYDYPYMMDYRGDYRRDYRDYGEGEDYLPEDELMEWCEDLMEEVEPKDKGFFTKDNIRNRADMMNIKFDEFTPEEFHVTVLMMYTDYKEPLGTTNLDVYLPLAKSWLMDKDSDLQGGEKLAAYYYNVVCADEN